MAKFNRPGKTQPHFSERQTAYREGWEDSDAGYPKDCQYEAPLLVNAYNKGYSDASLGLFDDNAPNSY